MKRNKPNQKSPCNLLTKLKTSDQIETFKKDSWRAYNDVIVWNSGGLEAAGWIIKGLNCCRR